MVGYLSFGSPFSASAVSKPIFEIKATEDMINIYTPMLSGSGKNVLYSDFLDASASTKINGDGFATYFITR